MRDAMQIIDDPVLRAMFVAKKRKRGLSGGREPEDHSDSVGSTGTGRGSGASNVGARPTAGQLTKNAERVQQAVVKITRNGRTSGGKALRNQLQYISRKGAVEIEGSAGEVFEPGASGRHEALADDWQVDFDGMDERATFATYHVVVTYPEGTDPVAAEMAARDFAQELTDGRYGDRYKYALAHHRDTDYPHSHIVLNRAGADGSTLHLSKDGVSVQDLRELHVETAQSHGIELNATSRVSRNIEDRPSSSGRLHAGREGRSLPEIAHERPDRDRYPFYGAAQRRAFSEAEKGDLHEGVARSYDRVAEELAGKGVDEGSTVSKVKAAAGDIRDGKALVPEKDGEKLEREQAERNARQRRSRRTRDEGIDR